MKVYANGPLSFMVSNIINELSIKWLFESSTNFHKFNGSGQADIIVILKLCKINKDGNGINCKYYDI